MTLNRTHFAAVVGTLVAVICICVAPSQAQDFAPVPATSGDASTSPGGSEASPPSVLRTAPDAMIGPAAPWDDNTIPMDGYAESMGGCAACAGQPGGRGCRRCRGGSVAGAAYVDWEYGQPDLFYNYYVPNNAGGVPAQLYIAPRPVPAHVGHTYYTYQPFMPHEFTYPHSRTYRRYYDGGRGMTRASAVWYCNPLTVGLQSVRQAIKIPR